MVSRITLHYNLDRILCVVLLKLKNDCIKGWDKSDENYGYHGNKKVS